LTTPDRSAFESGETERGKVLMLGSFDWSTIPKVRVEKL